MTVGDLRRELLAHDTLSHLAPESLKLIYKGKVLSDDQATLPSSSSASSASSAASSSSSSSSVARRVLQVMVTGSEITAIQGLQAAKADPTVQPFRRKVAASALAKPVTATAASGVPATAGDSKYGFQRIEVLRGLPNPDHARRILEQLASDPGIVHVMRKHQWSVGLLAEMYPEGKVAVDPVCVLGYNTNKGQSITLRLRTDDMRGFRYYETVKEVLFHELSHNVHSDHDNQFKALMSQLKREAAEGDWTRGGGHTVGGGEPRGAGEGGLYQEYEIDEETTRFNEVHRLGGVTHGRPQSQEAAREVLAAAAATRLSQHQGSPSPPPPPKAASPPSSPMKPVPVAPTQTSPPPTQTSPPPTQTTLEDHGRPRGPEEEKEEEQRPGDSAALLMSMGFQEAGVRVALSTSSGDVDRAIQLLLSSNSGLQPEIRPDPSRAEEMEVDAPERPTEEGQVGEGGRGDAEARSAKIREAAGTLRRNHGETAAAESLRTVLTYLSNALSDPTNDKFRRIRANNQVFQTRVAQREGGLEILRQCGFHPEGDYWVLRRDDPGLLWLGKSLVEEQLQGQQ